MLPPLQGGFCGADKTGPEYLTDFQFIEAVTCTYADPMGMLVLGMIFYSAIGLSIYIRTGSVIIPTILLFLTGGAVIAQVAAPATAGATILILAAGGGVVAYLYHRFT